MKKTSILLFIFGLSILYGLSRLYPVPQVSPVRVENETDQMNGSGAEASASFTSGKFIFPYYRHAFDKKPSWVFRGSKGTVIRKKNDQILVQNPRIKHFPSASTSSSETETNAPDIKEVTITGNQGRKQPGNVAFIKENVQVLTDQGGELTTRQLYANFENDRLYTRSNHNIEMTHPGLFVEGIGFSGNSRLSQFTFRKDVYLRLSTSRLRSLSVDGTNQPPIEETPYFITADGPLNARLIDETDSKRKWKLSVSRNVYLYQMRVNGSRRQSSEQLHLTLVEQKNRSEKGEAPKSTNKNDSNSNLQLSAFEAIGQVHIVDRGIEIWSDRAQMERKERIDVFDLKGDTQKIDIREAANRNRGTNSLNEPSSNPQQATRKTTSVRVAGTGRLERPRTASRSDTSASTPKGLAHFEGQVFVHRNNARLQSNSLSIRFFETPSERRMNISSDSARSNAGVKIQGLEARKNVLFLNEKFAASGNHLSWSPPKQTIDIRSKENSVISNVQNRIEGQRIHIDRADSSLTSRRNVHTTINTKPNQGFQLFGLSEPSDSESQNDADPTRSETERSKKWNLHSDQLTFKLRPNTNQLRNLKATGHVQISSDRVNGYGNRFVFRRSESKAVLQGDNQKARLHQDQHRALADSFHFQLDHQNVMIKGQKRLRIAQTNHRSESEENRSSDRPNRWTGPFELISGAPTIVHKNRGRLRVMGPSQVLKPGGHMRSQRVNVRFNPETNEVQTVRLNGDVFIRDRSGSAMGDLARWTVSNDRLTIRGQPFATVNRSGRTARYEIINLWNNWNSLRGTNYKWRSPGTVQEQE